MTMVATDELVLCKAALVFALTRCVFSFALNLLTSMAFFSTSSSSSTNLKAVTDTLSLTTFGSLKSHLDDDEACAVCLNTLSKKSQVWELRNCCHVFHKQCLERWLCYDNKLSCPLCRASLLQTRPAQTPSWAVDRMLYLFGDDLLPACSS